MDEARSHATTHPHHPEDGSFLELVITPGHARARLRQADLAVERQKARYRDEQMPKRFGPRARATHHSLMRAFTRDRVKLLRQTGRDAEWLALDKIGQDDYQLQVTHLRKTPRGVVTTVGALPVIFTSHFVERFIQSRRSEAIFLVDTCQTCINALQPLHVGARNPDGTRAVEWSASGDAWVRTPNLLLLGEIQHGAPVVMRTVLRDDVLDPEKQLVWDRLQASNRQIAVFQMGREIPLCIAA